MSPLVDVTNTSGQSVSGSQYTDSLRKSGSEEAEFCSIVTKANSEKGILQIYYSSDVKTEEVAIKMCNTQVSCNGKNSTGSSCQTSIPPTNMCSGRKNSDTGSAPNQEVDTDVLLSEAVQTLTLGGRLNTEPRRRKQRQGHRHRSRKGSDPIVAVNNSSKLLSSSCGLPDNPPQCINGVSSPQQCGACGLEFTSLPKLTQHLTRHVFDGLYAAQWLTQAMKLVNSRHTSTTVEADSSSRDGTSLSEIVQQDSSDE
ncbi:hypothetical protein Pcinc_030942 [Petrolisthes cinctipes]|uniref:C2H2-type domain-containing protein n=1 Tax=Petrolisthes cinctipes TaxID=88211 RepID=A0AAE1EXD1_PETCI|nr:hypothetical protein Pcinc_030942 [Petrolisthes cinctipes]